MCLLYACKTFLRVRNGDVASQQGVLGGSWTRLGSKAQWTSQMPCSRVAIADWLHERGQRSVAAFVGRQTRGRCDLVDGNWTRDLSARHDGPSQMRVRCLAVVCTCGDWLEGGQRPAKRGCVCPDTGGKPGDAAISTHAHGHLLMTIDIAKCPRRHRFGG